MINSIRNFLKEFSTKNKNYKKEIVKWTKPDKEGITYAIYEDGTQSKVGLKTFTQKQSRRVQLYAQGLSKKEVDSIIKSEERDKKINQILEK